MKKLILFLALVLSLCTTKLEAQILNLRFYLEGYMNTNSNVPVMNEALYNWNMWSYENFTSNPPNTKICDLVDVILLDGSNPTIEVFRNTVLVDREGFCKLIFPKDLIGVNVYVVIRSRNHIRTSSSVCVKLEECSEDLHYDFTTAQSQAFNNNQVEVSPGVWAFYGGDITQDGVVDVFDFIILNGVPPNCCVACNVASDLTGDNAIDIFDELIYQNNTLNEVTFYLPTINDPCNVNKTSKANSISDFNVNRTNNYLNIGFTNFEAGNSIMFIFDMTGKLISKENFVIEAGKNQKQFETSELASGTYILKIQNAGKSYSKKFSVE